MDNYLNGKIIYERPERGYFSRPDQYLRLQNIVIEEATPPILEDDSMFLYVQSGSGTMMINGVAFPLSAGNFCWLQSYHVFSLEPAWGETLKLRLCVYDYPLTSYMTYFDTSNLQLDIFTQRPPIINCTPELAKHISGLMDEFESEDAISDPGSALIRASILGELSNIFMSESLAALKRDGPVARTRGWDILVYLSMSCSKNMTAADVAAVFGLTTERLNLELRKVCAMSFSKVLSRARVNMAASSVLFGELSFSFISARSGFRTDAEFYRAFKEFKGMTPQEYRNMCIGNTWFRRTVDETALSVLHYLYVNSREPISLSSLSKALFISEHTIRKVLKESFGETFQSILTSYRLRNAEALLVVSEMPILDISVSVGFNSERSFSRLFKAAHGISPSAYRKKYRR